MTNPAPSRPKCRRTRWGSLLRAASVMIALGAVLPVGAAEAAPLDDSGWTTDVATVAVARRGDTVSFTITVTASTSQWALIDFEIWNADPTNPGRWLRPVHQSWDSERFVADRPRTFVATWEIPDDEALNVHYAKVGVFDLGWAGGLHHWNDAAAVFTVTAASTPPPTTIVPPTTTPNTTTTTRPTTTTTSPPPPVITTPPPAGAQFAATFDTPTDFYGRFNIYAGNFVDRQLHRIDWWLNNGGSTPDVVLGDHDMACGGPDTVRRLDVRNPDWTQYFWYCAPGADPAKGHVMTGFTTTGYVVFGFSPNRSFTNVRKVCWDVNATEQGGGKWTNMVIVPESTYQQFAPRLDYVTQGFNDDAGVGDFNIQAGDHPGTDVWGIKDFRGGQHLFIGDDLLFSDYTVHTTMDKATRYQHCVEETSASTSRLTVQRPGGGTSVYNLPSGMPDGTVRVIFQDDMYDPLKRDGYNASRVTWHWDNIYVY